VLEKLDSMKTRIKRLQFKTEMKKTKAGNQDELKGTKLHYG